MVIHENDLVVATHGRSFRILDDLTLLYQALEMKPDEPVFLFKPAETVLYWGYYREKPVNAGETLPVGAPVNYYLKEKPKEDEAVALTFLDGDGKTIRTFSQKPAKKGEPAVPVQAGMNRFVWDLRYPANHEVKGAVFWGPAKITPRAIPGNFAVRLSVGKKEIERSFEMVKDPNLPISPGEYRQQFDFQMKIRDKLSQVHDAVNEIRNIRRQLDWYKERTQKKPYFEKIDKAAGAIEEKLKPVEEALIQRKAKATQDLLNYPIKLNNKLAALGAWVVESSEGAPTQQALAVFADLVKRVDVHLEYLKQVIDTDVAAFNRLIRDLEVPAVMLRHYEPGKE